jgi:hypothetical protein
MHVSLDFLHVDFLVDVAEASPWLWHLELKVRHIQLQRFCWAVVVPELQASLDVVESLKPLSLHVAFECLSEDWRKLLDVLLKTHNITVQREHVVDAFVFEALDVDGLVLRQFYEVTDFVVFGDHRGVYVIKTEIEGVDTHWVLALLHSDNIDLAKSVAGF